jgi:GT2 family glycosyltransferase
MSRAGTKGNLESPSDQPVDQHPESTRVTAVLVTHNSAGVIIDALASLAGILAIVVDNGSGDGTCDLVTKRFPATTILSSTTNVGFGRANNLALGRVKTEFAFLLNPDARLVPETLPELLRAADRYPDAAILAPVLADASGRREPSVRVPFLDRRRHGSNLDIHEPRGDTCVEMVSGAAMLVRMSALGPRRELFDPNIFLYFEDDDACMQLRRRGFSLVLVPTATVVHLEGTSSDSGFVAECNRTRHRIASRLYVDVKYRGSARGNMRALRLLLKNTLTAPLYLLSLRPRKAGVAASRVLGVATYYAARVKRVRQTDIRRFSKTG